MTWDAFDHRGFFIQVEDDVAGVVQEIYRRWPDLKIQFLDPDQHPDLTDAPYRIVHADKNGNEYTVLECWQLDGRIITALEMMDGHKMDLTKLYEAEIEKSRKAAEEKKKETREEIKDILSHTFKSPKGKYSFRTLDEENKLVIIEDG